MSKVVMSLPKGMVKDVTVGTVVSLGTYVGLQFLWALLIDRGMLGMERLYPLVCIAAALASFLGCGCTLLRGREATAFPNFQKDLEEGGARLSPRFVVRDGTFITARGLGVSTQFGLALAEALASSETAAQIKSSIQFSLE